MEAVTTLIQLGWAVLESEYVEMEDSASCCIYTLEKGKQVIEIKVF